ncbi:putative auxin efflux carrier component 6 [Zostera marina]|uniref:Auxin efflux carrier component n=1 Tax=Zostera marina TaxID=29655 RepID=A0A0K9NPP6_ZOSMR|nr:putative auxin efflux carrier component 6 [Zostera marina]
MSSDASAMSNSNALVLFPNTSSNSSMSCSASLHQLPPMPPPKSTPPLQTKMIEWDDVYKVIEAVMPLYVAILMGYLSVRLWKIFTPVQCEAINLFVSFFTQPFFTLEFTLHTDPFSMNFPIIAADAISKVIIVAVLFAWAKFAAKGSYEWAITNFSLANLTSPLIVGVPMVRSMYGQFAQEIVVQLSVVQSLVWLTLLLFVLELRKSNNEVTPFSPTNDSSSSIDDGSKTLNDIEKIVASEDLNVEKPLVCALMKRVMRKLMVNPNSYACFIDIIWACIAKRYNFEMPKIIEECVLILSKAGLGMSMFSLGLFMGSQKKLVACGASLFFHGLALKFVVGPIAMAIGSFLVGLRGDLLRIAIIQAVVPLSTTSFIYAHAYGLHPQVLSTAIIFGMFTCLPIFMAYYFILKLVP